MTKMQWNEIELLLINNKADLCLCSLSPWPTAFPIVHQSVRLEKDTTADRGSEGNFDGWAKGEKWRSLYLIDVVEVHISAEENVYHVSLFGWRVSSLLKKWATILRVVTSVISSGFMHVSQYNSAKTIAIVSLKKELYIHSEGRSNSDLSVSLRAVQYN